MDERICEYPITPETASTPDTFAGPGELTHDEFSGLALSYESDLRRVARSLTRDPFATEDLVQETYLRALQARQAFRPKGLGMRPWLLRILRNLYLNRRASDARRPAAVPGEQLDCLPSAEWISKSGCPDGIPSVTTLDGMDQELARAIATLPSAHQAVLMLCAVEELTCSAVASVVNAPVGTVMSRLHRAREQLSRRLAGFATRQGIPGHRGGAPPLAQCP